MSLKKILLVAVTFLVVYGGLSLPCQAQNPYNRRLPLRWLGQGFSDGYHRHNPGHDTSYYNPYTAHNSTLVSQSPEYQALLAQQASQQPSQRFFAGVPFSVYAAPSQLTPGLHNLPGQQVQGSFSPSTQSVLGSDSDFSFSENNDIDDQDDNDFREDEDDNEFREDEDDIDFDDDEDIDFDEDDDSEFRDDEDSEFRDDEDDAFDDDVMDEKDAKEEMQFENLDDIENVDVNTTDDLGGLSGLNDSLSFDFD